MGRDKHGVTDPGSSGSGGSGGPASPKGAARTEADQPTTVRPVLTLDPDLVLPAPALLAPPIFGDLDLDLAVDVDLDLVRPPAVAPVRRRGVRAALVTLLVAACAALPWAVPQIPDLFADAVPVPAATVPTRTDPPIAPPTPVPAKAPSTALDGKRLLAGGTPLEVIVPRLRVSSPVVPISGQSGELVPPDDPQLLGWWKEGSRVGSARGSAVVTGHTVSVGGGAFDHLGDLVRGDRVQVRTSAGTIEYVVRESRDVPVAELARTSKAIFDQSVPGRLVLITCSDFNGKIYLSNAVVYAVPVKDDPRR